MATEEQKRKARARARAVYAIRFAAYMRAVGAQPEFQERVEQDGEEEPAAEALTMDRTDITMDRTDITFDMTEL